MITGFDLVETFLMVVGDIPIGSSSLLLLSELLSSSVNSEVSDLSEESLYLPHDL
jgi:hypothetical protein